MTYKIKKLIALLLCLILLLFFSRDGYSVNYWAVKCGRFGGSMVIGPSNQAKINVNDNNLYISARLAKDSNGDVQVFFQDVIESTNDKINWEGISKIKTIAVFSINNGIMHMAWKGFFDIKKKSYIWKGEPDFVVVSGGDVNVEMHKCDF